MKIDVFILESLSHSVMTLKFKNEYNNECEKGCAQDLTLDTLKSASRRISRYNLRWDLIAYRLIDAAFTENTFHDPFLFSNIQMHPIEGKGLLSKGHHS